MKLSFLYIIVLSLGSLATLFVLTKLSGNRQISSMSMFDYIAGISIGSIAAEMATNLDRDWYLTFTALLTYGLMVALITVLTNKSFRIRSMVNGRPIVLLKNGKLYRESFRKARLDLNEFLALCRNAGYFSIDQIAFAQFETNGQISFRPKADMRTVTLSDLKIPGEPDLMCADVVLDGKLMEGELKKMNISKKNFYSQMKAMGIDKVDDVFYAQANSNSQVYFYTN